MLTVVLAFTTAKTTDVLLERLLRIAASRSIAPETPSQSMTKLSRWRRAESSMALEASVRSSSPIRAALKVVRMTSSSAASPVSSRQPKPIFSIYANDLDSQSDGGTQDGRLISSNRKKKVAKSWHQCATTTQTRGLLMFDMLAGCKTSPGQAVRPHERAFVK